MINTAKRRTLKALSFSALGVIGAIHIPKLTASPDITKSLSSTEAESPVTISHYGSVNGRNLLIKNNSDRQITLSKIQPSRINTPSGSIDLNVLLENKPLSIPSNSTQAVRIGSNGDVQMYARWKHSEAPTIMASNTRPVNNIKVTSHEPKANIPLVTRTHEGVLT